MQMSFVFGITLHPASAPAVLERTTAATKAAMRAYRRRRDMLLHLAQYGRCLAALQRLLLIVPWPRGHSRTASFGSAKALRQFAYVIATHPPLRGLT